MDSKSEAVKAIQRSMPMSDRARAEAYRMRLRRRGGARLTITPGESDLVREALRFALEHQSWSEDDRASLERLSSALQPAS